jgi:vacuolar protein sorting-associated protein 13A/C
MESIVASLLNMYLGAYVQDLSKENLTFSISRGDVQLENLAIRKEALQDLKLPVTVKTGMTKTHFSGE